MSHIENIHKSIECLAELVQNKFTSASEEVYPEEMGSYTDMLKDLSEGLYYSTIVNEMKEGKEEEEMLNKLGITDSSRFYNDYRYANGQYAPRKGYSKYPIMYPDEFYDRRGYNMHYPEVYDPVNSFSRNKFRLGYDNGNGESSYSQNGMRSYDGMSESNFDRARRAYMTSKLSHNSNTTEDDDANVMMINKVGTTISEEVLDMLKDASPKVKTALRNQLSTLVTKI